MIRVDHRSPYLSFSCCPLPLLREDTSLWPEGTLEQCVLASLTVWSRLNQGWNLTELEALPFSLVLDVQTGILSVIKDRSCCFRDIHNGIVFQRKKHEADAAEIESIGSKGQGEEENERKERILLITFWFYKTWLGLLKLGTLRCICILRINLSLSQSKWISWCNHT